MSMPSRGRAHLVERAAEAFSDPNAFTARQPGPAPEDPPAKLLEGQALRLPEAPVARLPGADAEAPGNRRPEAPVPPAKPAIAMSTMVSAGLTAVPSGSQRSRVVEELALAQQQVLRGMEDTGGRNRVVLVTSARPGEGKTFIAVNLAASMANSGTRKVVLVDVDGKRGSISDALGLGEAAGLRQLAASPQERGLPLLQTTEIRNLLVLPYGRAVADAAHVPSGTQLAEAITRLARSLPDHVLVLDTPPSLSTSDANALSAMAGQVVMVVDAGRTQRSEVEAALDMMEACPLLQLLLNRVSMTASDSFGAYGDYGMRHAK
ncbi:CpsD/CapB family tyrosine-protein kinase [Roseomonas sp. ACRSG]|nr:CpsD/CapB family tyrosine-protein kinase [Roseomonas sp. ACRSG]